MLQTNLVPTRGKLRSPKKNGGIFGAARVRMMSAPVGSHSLQTMFLKGVRWRSAVDECENTVVWRMGEVNSALETCGLRQNAGKLVILPILRRTVENRTFSRSKQEYQIKASHRFLGIVYLAMLSMGAEIDRRIWATNRAWRELHGMWWNKRVPYKIKRTLFRGRGAWKEKLRALMRGTASWEGQDHMRTLSSRQVWKRWRLAPPAYKLCVQRLRWYQSTAREPACHAHLLCWFGRMHFESHDTLIDGLRLHPDF